jgi:hypothetical protein
VSSIESQINAQLATALASISLSTDFTANQVTISSQAQQFGTFFGNSIVAPLVPAGFFTTTVPFLGLNSISPDLNLVANVFGVIPGQCSGFLPTTGALLPFGNATLANPSFTAFNPLIGTNTAAANLAAINASTMPLTFLITPPLIAPDLVGTALPLTTVGTSPLITCSGSIPLGCN